MRHKYYFRSENKPLHANSVVYVVTVGQSERDKKAFQWMKAYAYDNGLTFMRWGEDVDYYLELERESIFPRSGICFNRFKMITLSVQQLRTVARSIGFQFYEKSIYFPRTFFEQMKALNPACFSKFNQKKIPKVSHREKRKYLSHKVTNQ